jgi:hypothetical protein
LDIWEIQKRVLKTVTSVEGQKARRRRWRRIESAGEKIIMADNRRSGGAGGVPC